MGFAGATGASTLGLSRPAQTQPCGERGETLSDALFIRLSRFVYDYCGVKLPLAKKVLLEGRLRKRLHALGISTFEAYCTYLFSARGAQAEIAPMIDVVTTHKTDFFREPKHFEYLAQNVLPDLGSGAAPLFRVWSAACSTGEEAYSLAMVLAEYAAARVGVSFRILATDISMPALATARLGIYREERIAPISAPLRKRYLMRSKEPDRRLVRVAPEVRSLVDFRSLNLMEPFNMNDAMDVIFCRNVIIYFDRACQERLVARLHDTLAPGGYLFMGHSETLNGFSVPLEYVAPSIYRRSV